MAIKHQEREAFGDLRSQIALIKSQGGGRLYFAIFIYGSVRMKDKIQTQKKDSL